MDAAVSLVRQACSSLKLGQCDLLLGFVSPDLPLASTIFDCLIRYNLRVKVLELDSSPGPDHVAFSAAAASSSAIALLVSRGFQTWQDARGALRTAQLLRQQSKPALIANAVPGRWSDWAEDSFATLAGFKDAMYADVSQGAAFDPASSDVDVQLRASLMGNPNAGAPKLVQLLRVANN